MANFGETSNEQDFQERALEINKKKLLEISFISEQREEDLKELQIVNQTLQVQLERGEGESQRLQAIVEQYQEQLSVLPALLEEKSALSDENNLLGVKLAEYQEKLDCYASENQKFLEAHESLKNDHNTLITEHKSLAQLTKEQQLQLDLLHNIETDFATCAQDLKIAHTENASLRTSLEEVQERQRSDKIELDSAKKRGKRLQKELNELRHEYTQFIAERSRKYASYEERINSVEKENHNFSIQYSDLNSRYEKCVFEINNKTEQNEQLQQHIQALENEVSYGIGELEHAKILGQDLQTQLSRIGNEYELLAEERSAAQLDNESRLLASEHELQNLATEHHDVKNKYEAHLNDLTFTHSENNNLREQVVSLQDQLSGVETELLKTSQSEQLLRSQLDGLQDKHTEFVEQQSIRHENYVNKLKAVFSQQRHEVEQEYLKLMSKRVSSNESNLKTINQLLKYRNRVELEAANTGPGLKAQLNIDELSR